MRYRESFKVLFKPFYIIKIDANPRNDKKPKTSVIVVKITPEAKAGSTLNLCKVIGINVPAKPANNKLRIIANAITIPRRVSPNQ